MGKGKGGHKKGKVQGHKFEGCRVGGKKAKEEQQR